MSADDKSKIKKYDPWEFLDNKVNYVALVDRPGGLGVIPQNKLGGKIAIIGAGASGLCAAYELMKIGLQPVIYEAAKNSDGTPRIGGRLYTYRFPGDPKAFAELGAMRIPATNKLIAYYMDCFGIDYSRPFPDPLLVPTNLYFDGVRHYIPVGGALPAEISAAKAAWENFITPLKTRMARAWDNPDSRTEVWFEYIGKYADKSFYSVLREAGISEEHIRLFGSLGFGTGGFDSMYQVSFLEMLRLLLCRWEDDQRLVKGGVDQVPLAFWTQPRQAVHWGKRSLEELSGGSPLPAVKEIFTPADPQAQVSVTDIGGNTAHYDAVIFTCSPRVLEMDVRVNRPTFSNGQWAALRSVHLTNSGKVFVRTKKASWKDSPAESTITCTISDEVTRGTYLFDFEDTESGVICLSYTWEDSAIKFDALSNEERVELGIETLEKIYGKDLISNQAAESVSFFWEQEKGYNGAFKLNYPGQYEKQKTLFLQPFSPQPGAHNGVFLAGDAVSWAGGWVEGALHAGLNAAAAVIFRLGGRVHSSLDDPEGGEKDFKNLTNSFCLLSTSR